MLEYSNFWHFSTFWFKYFHSIHSQVYVFSGSKRGLGLQGSGLKNAGLQGSKTEN